MLIDTHAHLTSNRFRGKIEDLIAQSTAAGVGHTITIGCDIEDSVASVKLAAKHPQISATVGVHPCYVGDVQASDWCEQIEALATANPVAAIGEIGLDYYHAPPKGYDQDSWRARQADFFKQQLQLAERLDLPVVIHQRESGDDNLAILEDFPNVKAVLHCFTGTPVQAEKAISMGHYLSFTGVVTYPKAPEVREIAKWVPEDRFMVETDSPYLAPVPFRGKSNQPAYVTHTAKQIAEVRGISEANCAEITTRNAHSFFKGLPE